MTKRDLAKTGTKPMAGSFKKAVAIFEVCDSKDLCLRCTVVSECQRLFDKVVARVANPSLRNVKLAIQESGLTKLQQSMRS